MKLICTKKKLGAGLQVTSRVISPGNILPILNNILLKTDKGRLKLSSTNLETAINTWVGGKIEEEGEITVPAKLINEFVNNLITEKITISTQNHTVLLEGENTRTHINGLGAEDFPLIPPGGEEVYAKIEGKELKRVIGEVVFATAFSETQPEISGLLFNFEGKQLILAGTDRYRLAEGRAPLLDAAEPSHQIIIPARAVNEVNRLVGEGPVEIYLKEGQACFKTVDTELTSRLIEGQYPDYKQIVPTGFTTEAELSRAEFGQSLKAVSLFASENNNVELELNPQGKHLFIRSQSAQVGDSEIRVEAKVTGQKNSIIFNYRYLLECLSNLHDEKVVLKVTSSSAPASLAPLARDNYFYIVMPIKV